MTSIPSNYSKLPPIVSTGVEDQVSIDPPEDNVCREPEHQDTVHNDSRARTREALDLPEKLQQTRLQSQLDVLGYNSRGPAVLELQKNLNEWRVANGKPPIAEDQHFGRETEAAVRDFQQATGLKADGLAGPQVKARLALEKDADFKKLDPGVQQKICDQWIKTEKNPAARENLRQVFKDSHFQNLSPESQKLALDRLAARPNDPAHTSNIKLTMIDVDSLEHDTAFQKLHPDTRKDVRRSMFQLSDSPASSGLSELAKDPEFGSLTRAEQSKVIGVVMENKKDGTVPPFLQDVLNSRTMKRHPGGPVGNAVLEAAKDAAPDPDKQRNLTNLLNDPKFVHATDDEQLAMLNVLRAKTGLEKTSAST